MKKVSASHILIMHEGSKDSRSEITKTEAKLLANDIYKKLKNGKAFFRDMAVKHSNCSSASYGGSLGEFGKGVMVAGFEKVAFSLNVNEISKPIETEFGYHIIKRDA